MSECVWEIGMVSWVCHLPSSTGGCEQVERLLLKTSARKTSWTIGVSKRNLWKQFWSILSSTTREISSNWKLSPTNRAFFQVERIRWGHRGPPVGLLVTPVSLGPKSWKKLRHQRDYHIYIYTFNTIDNTIRVDFWSCVYHGYHLWSVYHTCRLSHDPMCVIDICMAENLRRTKLNDFSQIKKYLI